MQSFEFVVSAPNMVAAAITEPDLKVVALVQFNLSGSTSETRTITSCPPRILFPLPTRRQVVMDMLVLCFCTAALFFHYFGIPRNPGLQVSLRCWYVAVWRAQRPCGIHWYNRRRLRLVGLGEVQR